MYLVVPLSMSKWQQLMPTVGLLYCNLANFWQEMQIKTNLLHAKYLAYQNANASYRLFVCCRLSAFCLNRFNILLLIIYSSCKYFALVKFTEEKDQPCSVIPSNCLLGNDKCLWSPFNDAKRWKATREMLVPSEDWQQCAVLVKYKASKYYWYSSSVMNIVVGLIAVAFVQYSFRYFTCNT